MTSGPWQQLSSEQQQSMHRLFATVNRHQRKVEQRRKRHVRIAASVPSMARAHVAHYRLADTLVVEGMPMPEDLKDIYAELRRDRQFAQLKKGANFVGGDGPRPQPRAVLIGEAPGANEDKLGKPFVGASGNFLESMMSYAGLKRSQCFITNVVKWRPPSNRTPTREEVEASVPYLRREVMSVLPRGGLMILLGSVALDVVDQSRRVSKVHGHAFPKGIWTFMPMWHPSYVMQNRAPRDAYVADWEATGKLVIK